MISYPSECELAKSRGLIYAYVRTGADAFRLFVGQGSVCYEPQQMVDCEKLIITVLDGGDLSFNRMEEGWQLWTPVIQEWIRHRNSGKVQETQPPPRKKSVVIDLEHRVAYVSWRDGREWQAFASQVTTLEQCNECFLDRAMLNLVWDRGIPSVYEYFRKGEQYPTTQELRELKTQFMRWFSTERWPPAQKKTDGEKASPESRPREHELAVVFAPAEQMIYLSGYADDQNNWSGFPFERSFEEACTRYPGRIVLRMGDLMGPLYAEQRWWSDRFLEWYYSSQLQPEATPQEQKPKPKIHRCAFCSTVVKPNPVYQNQAAGYDYCDSEHCQRAHVAHAARLNAGSVDSPETRAEVVRFIRREVADADAEFAIRTGYRRPADYQKNRFVEPYPSEVVRMKSPPEEIPAAGSNPHYEWP